MTTIRQWVLAALTAAGWLVAGPAYSAPMLYDIEPHYTTLEFVVENMWGSFSTTGSFTRFSGELLLDLDTPENSHVDVTAEAASILTVWDNANRMLVSGDYLDPAHFPTVHYVSERVEKLAPDHVILHGHLTLRGVTCPVDLDARLKSRHNEPGVGLVADFVVKGQFAREDFGITADYPLVAKEVSLRISSYILLASEDNHG